MQNNYEMIRMCILTFGLAGLSWEDMRKQQLHGWAILLLGISGMTISLLGGCWNNFNFQFIFPDIWNRQLEMARRNMGNHSCS